MKNTIFSNYIYPIATLTGGIIGVGFLSLPYVTSRVGVWVMLLYFAFLTPMVIFIHVALGRISLKTPDHKRFPGFVRQYSGKELGMVSLILSLFGSFGTLLVYLLIGGQFLMAVFSPIFGGELFYYILFYFLVLSFLVYVGINLISRVEFWALSLLAFSIIAIFVKGFSQISLENIFSHAALAPGDWKTLFLPYGAVMFSLWGTGLIPEVEEMVRGRKKSLISIIITSVSIAAIFYLIFTFIVLGISGNQTTESALIGLKGFLGGGIISVALFIGVITTCTAFIGQAVILKEVFMYDMKMPHFPAWAFTCFIPLILFLIGVQSFVPLISFIGGVLLSLNGIFILLMYQKIGGKKSVVYTLILFFILAILYSMINVGQ